MMATTLAGLRAQCRALLASTADWPDATLDRFIADAIRTYSAEFPRQRRHTLNLATGTQRYPLPGGHGYLGMVSVEYPAGQSPPRFLVAGAGYRLLGAEDAVLAVDDVHAGAIHFTESVTTGESAELTYKGVHHLPAVGADADLITVPEAHHEALIAFVDFRCHWELETDEAVLPNQTSIVLAMLGENGRRAWNRWRELMARLTPVQGGAPGWVTWGRMGL
jgi:hypothetical protein